DRMKALGFRSGENDARWSHLKHILAAPEEFTSVKHRAALDFKLIPEAMKRLRALNGNKRRALEFCILAGARRGEIRAMEHSEIDYEAKLWVVPPNHFKGK